MRRENMTTGEGAVAIRVCFRSAIKNADIIIGTRDVSKARMVARIWGERTEGEPVTRTIFKGANRQRIVWSGGSSFRHCIVYLKGGESGHLRRENCRFSGSVQLQVTLARWARVF
jgi:hypothetical protein